MPEYKNRVLTVDVLILNSDRHILLIRRGADPYKDHWALPGGYMEYDETSEQAARRELQEETGLSADRLTLLGVFDDPARHPQQRVSVAYYGTATGRLSPADDALETMFFPLDKLPEKLAFDHATMITQLGGVLPAGK
ncbi:MAG: Bifunctional NMN adenylyltransferase/Nudix hydrolase [candidate division WS6 bacterium OLB20]|uniref:Bifunctional NMN adenylyltransferase/Nudix hydrolase n=1 Tax=candidate division WS6 bacterium OLB20 TaxID=1617426 RepID=A0A136LYZ3_9BACT|nr:MAG: Bifunctional NMN adenylyltransferase/Nudix hydrolase [candidate division WS6 bacterium OLB20]